MSPSELNMQLLGGSTHVTSDFSTELDLASLCVTDNILSVTLILYIIHIRVRRLIHIPRDILLPVYMYLLYLLDGTVVAWMKSPVFIHLTQLPSNPIIFGFGRLALRCDFSKTKIQPLTIGHDYS